jgi:hypothetical protein
MDRGKSATTSALKLQLVQDLQAARHALVQETHLAQVDLRPAALLSRSFAEHRTAWLIGGAVAGILLIRVLLPPKHIRSDKNDQPATKRGFRATITSLALSLARRAAMNYATDHFKDTAQNYLDSLLTRQGKA